MNRDLISEIGIDPTGVLFLRPQEAAFPFIYREGIEVNWDARRKALTCPPLDRIHLWTPVNAFFQILRAAEDQGCILQLSSDTKWVNTPAEIQKEIINRALGSRA